MAKTCLPWPGGPYAKLKTIHKITIVLVASLSYSALALGSHTQLRLDNDIAAGKPIVIQVSVALANNKNQGIVPVPESIGNGQDARTNLYWGARYGLKTYLTRDGGWQKVASQKPKNKYILERLVLKKTFSRNGQAVQVYLVADGWDGKFIKNTIRQFLNHCAGIDVVTVTLKNATLPAGGSAHLVVYIGHNALMEYAGSPEFLSPTKDTSQNKRPNNAIVLACESVQYFKARLEKIGAYPLVLTTGLMAPEAYSLQAAIEKWFAGADDIQVRKATAAAYNKYQKTGRKAAERLFGVK